MTLRRDHFEAGSKPPRFAGHGSEVAGVQASARMVIAASATVCNNVGMLTVLIRSRAAATPCLIAAMTVLAACSSGHAPAAAGAGPAVIPSVHIDAPAPGATVSGTAAVSGWAIDNASTVGTAITTVQVKVDGAAVGNATYGVGRPDVCVAYPGRPGCPNVGYSYLLNTAALASGSHTITVTATDSANPSDTGSATITVQK